MPAAVMLHEKDPKQTLLDKIGSVDDVELFHNQVLVAVYMAPEKTAGGIIKPTMTQSEDRHQSKVGLVLKTGPRAFKPDENWSWPDDMSVGDWVFFRVSDGWQTTLNSNHENLCRILDDVHVRGRISHPDKVW